MRVHPNNPELKGKTVTDMRNINDVVGDVMGALREANSATDKATTINRLEYAEKMLGGCLDHTGRFTNWDTETGCAVCNPALDPRHKTDDIAVSMQRHWRGGARTPQFQKLVLDDNPDCTPEDFSRAAWSFYQEMDRAAKEFSKNVMESTQDFDEAIPF